MESSAAIVLAGSFFAAHRATKNVRNSCAIIRGICIGKAMFFTREPTLAPTPVFGQHLPTDNASATPDPSSVFAAREPWPEPFPWPFGTVLQNNHTSKKGSAQTPRHLPPLRPVCQRPCQRSAPVKHQVCFSDHFFPKLGDTHTVFFCVAKNCG